MRITIPILPPMAKYTSKQFHSQQVLSPSPVQWCPERVEGSAMFGLLLGTHTIARKQIMPMTGFVGQNLGIGNFMDRKVAACLCER